MQEAHLPESSHWVRLGAGVLEEMRGGWDHAGSRLSSRNYAGFHSRKCSFKKLNLWQRNGKEGFLHLRPCPGPIGTGVCGAQLLGLEAGGPSGRSWAEVNPISGSGGRGPGATSRTGCEGHVAGGCVLCSWACVFLQSPSSQRLTLLSSLSCSRPACALPRPWWEEHGPSPPRTALHAHGVSTSHHCPPAAAPQPCH